MTFKIFYTKLSRVFMTLGQVFESIVKKGENADNKNFLFFQHSFHLSPTYEEGRIILVWPWLTASLFVCAFIHPPSFYLHWPKASEPLSWHSVCHASICLCVCKHFLWKPFSQKLSTGFLPNFTGMFLRLSSFKVLKIIVFHEEFWLPWKSNFSFSQSIFKRLVLQTCKK